MVAEADILRGQSISVHYISDTVSIGAGYFDISPPVGSKAFVETRSVSESVAVEINHSESVCV